MSRPLTEPSTPLRRVIAVDDDYANYSAPTRTRVSTIHLPPQELPGILSEMSSRRPSFMKQIPSPHHSRKPSPGRRRSSIHGLRETPQRRLNASSQTHTPNRRISDHLTIRRRRRSSTGVVYDSAFAGSVNKDFLRLFSRTLVKEKKQRIGEPDDQVYRALDRKHRISSTSPQVPERDFNLSLPLPSDDEMHSTESDPSPPESPEEISPFIQKYEPSKPVFKSYLEQILESRNRKSLRTFGLAFEKESSEEPSHPEELKNVINTSKFIIENTLSGLPDSWNDFDQSTSNLKLAEPVAFGLLHDDGSSNESSEKENPLPNSRVPFRRTRSPQIGLGNKTPESYQGIQFDNIDQLDVPSWEPVPIYNETISMDNELEDLNADDVYGVQDKYEPGSNNNIAHSDSESSQAGIISGHFTVDNDDIVEKTPEFLLPTPETIDRVASSASVTPIKKPVTVSASSFPEIQDLPKNLMKGFVTVAQNLSKRGSTGSPPRKRKKMHKLNADIVSLISQKSNEFLSQVMGDLSAYADHRNSKQINISDAILLINRVKSHHKLIGQEIDIPNLAKNVFPLESLVSLDNSIQESVETNMRRGNTFAERSAASDDSYYDE